MCLGIYEGGENYDVADLDLWIENFAPYIPLSTKPEDSSVDGGEGPVSQQNAGVEALLDITIAYELIYPQTVNVFSVDDSYYANGEETLQCLCCQELTMIWVRSYGLWFHGYHA